MDKLNVEEYLNKYCKDIPHARQVKKLSVKLFCEVDDKLKKLSERKKQLLETAALLHDIGYFIESKKHNKHTQNIILENGIDGFDEEETRKIATIARYHRGKNPAKKHKPFGEFDKKGRKTIKRLAGILRIADGLDSGHLNLINDLVCEYDIQQNVFSITLKCNTDKASPDIISAILKKDLFEKAFKTQVIIKLS